MSESDPSHPSASPLVPGRTLGRYRIERRLGSGGMSTIYAAVHVDLNKRVALKVLRSEFAETHGLSACFLLEGRAAARIRHPHVVDIYDVGSDGDLHFLVMELLDGEDLSAFLAREGPLSSEVTADLLLPICAALEAAHAQGVIHRDLKPSNIFLESGAAGVCIPKVVDFGISKVLDVPGQAGAQTGPLWGTPAYMSPEQLDSSQPLDHRTDIYSLGVVCYRCVTGVAAFSGGSVVEIAARIGRGDFRAPRTVQPSLEPRFESIIFTAMALRTSDRFASAADLGRALLPSASARQRAVWSDLFQTEHAGGWQVPSESEGDVSGGSPALQSPTPAHAPTRPLVDASVTSSRFWVLLSILGITAGTLVFAALRSFVPDRRPPLVLRVDARRNPEAGAPTGFELRDPSKAPTSAEGGIRLYEGDEAGQLLSKETHRSPAAPWSIVTSEERSPAFEPPPTQVGSGGVRPSVGDDSSVETDVRPSRRVPSVGADPASTELDESYEVSLSTRPKRAEVIIDGKKRGVGGYRGRFIRDGRSHRLVVRAPGFRSFRSVFSDRPPPRKIVLEPIERPLRRGTNDALILD